ncbi:MAG: hypothetical protein K2G75_01325 [Muribaculaceae bacterium]|nr:hypothetical protein [Muribaculaceae bacterium]
MKKEDTVKMYANEFLEGKSEKKVADFWAKPLDKQYSSIMAWKYRHNHHAENPTRRKRNAAAGLTAGDVLRHMRALPELIGMISQMADRDFDAMYAALDEARNAVSNYHATRQARLVAELEEQRDAIQRRIDALNGK